VLEVAAQLRPRQPTGLADPPVLIRRYDDGLEEDSPLDKIENAEVRFGSYRRLVASGEFRFTAR
jgi:hypothetical protein